MNKARIESRSSSNQTRGYILTANHSAVAVEAPKKRYNSRPTDVPQHQ